MSGDEILRRTVTIANPEGFHVRPQKYFMLSARKFSSTITVCRDDVRVDGKSPFELMLLSASMPGTELVIEARGGDAAQALDVLAPILAAPEDPPPEG